MRMIVRLVLAATCLVAVVPLPAAPLPVAQDGFQRAVARANALVDASRGVEGASPALAVVFVREGDSPVIRVEGVADARAGTAADAETPFYVASMTKSYVGLLAAKLDAEGVLPLDTTLASQWPGLVLPRDDAGTVTLRELLGHRAPFANSTLAFRTAYTDAVPAADYPRLLGDYSEPRDAGFQYDNLGYLVWAAVLEQRTGRSWHDWMATALLSPMGLEGTASDPGSLRDLPALPHQWTGAGWHVAEAKPKALMHAAGGMFVSPRDMAAWLQAHLAGHAPGVARGIFAAAHDVVPYPARDEEGASCDGYALGWHHCTRRGIDLLTHGGSYDGYRSRMAIVPGLGVGIAVLSNTDAMTGGLSLSIVDAFLSALPGAAGAEPDDAAIVAQYADDIRRQATSRQAAMDARRGEADWAGWQWRPGDGDLGDYTGSYANDRLGTIVVARGDAGLHADLGAMRFALDPARPDLFGASAAIFDAHDRFAFERDGEGRIVALSWGDRRFERQPPLTPRPVPPAPPPLPPSAHRASP